MQEILSENKYNAFYELFVTEVVHEVLREHRLESPLKLLNSLESLKFQRRIRWKSKGFFPPINPRTIKNENVFGQFSDDSIYLAERDKPHSFLKKR